MYMLLCYDVEFLYMLTCVHNLYTMILYISNYLFHHIVSTPLIMNMYETLNISSIYILTKNSDVIPAGIFFL